jgi:phosphoglycerate kinase
MEKELEYLQEKVVKAPAKPFVAVIGGAKVSSKIGVLEKLLEKVDCLIVGGGMAFTFFKAEDYEIGKSLCEDDQIGLAKAILDKSQQRKVRLILPLDQVVASEFSEKGEAIVVDARNMPPDMIGMDIGPKTIEVIRGALAGAKTIFWNGPLGVFEMEKFARGTMEVAKAISEIKDAVTVIGGGDSVAAVNKAGLGDRMSHISTGGGASLELVEGKTLPGVAALQDR